MDCSKCTLVSLLCHSFHPIFLPPSLSFVSLHTLSLFALSLSVRVCLLVFSFSNSSCTHTHTFCEARVSLFFSFSNHVPNHICPSSGWCFLRAVFQVCFLGRCCHSCDALLRIVFFIVHSFTSRAVYMSHGTLPKSGQRPNSDT